MSEDLKTAIKCLENIIGTSNVPYILTPKYILLKENNMPCKKLKKKKPKKKKGY